MYRDLHEQRRPMAWFPYTQTESSSGMRVKLRISGDPIALLPEIRRVVARLAPDLALLQPTTQQAEFEENIASQCLLARLSVSFALLAALLVALELYGTASYHVARRSSELGLRMALGVARRQVIWLMLSVPRYERHPSTRSSPFEMSRRVGKVIPYVPGASFEIRNQYLPLVE